MDKAFQAINIRGTYQNMIILSVIILPYTVLVVTAGYPFLTANSKILCREKDKNLKFEYCDLIEICKSFSNYEILKDYENSIHNWTYQFDLFCDKSFYIPLIGTSFFIGALLASIFLSAFPDKYGRLPIMKITLVINVFIQINFLIAKSIEHIIFICILSGFSSYSNSILSLVITENIDRKLSGIVMSLKNAMYGVSGICFALYFLFVNDLNLFFTINIIFSLLLLFLITNYFVESPRWLNSKNRMIECKEAFRKIAEINGSIENFEKFFEANTNLLCSDSVKNNSKVKKNHSLIDIFKFKSQRNKILILAYIWFANSFIYYGLIVNLDRPGGNIFIESIATFSAALFAEMASGWICEMYGRMIIMKLLSYIGGVCYIVYFFTDNKLLRSVLMLISSLGLCGTSNILYIYTPEAFPTSIRATSFGFLYLVSRIGAILIPIVSKLITFTPLLLGSMAILTALLTYHLEETLGQEMLDEIPELDRGKSDYLISQGSQRILKISRSSSKFQSILGNPIISDDYFRDSDFEIFKSSTSFKFKNISKV